MQPPHKVGSRRRDKCISLVILCVLSMGYTYKLWALYFNLEIHHDCER